MTLSALNIDLFTEARIVTERANDLTVLKESINLNKILNFALGTGALKANEIWYDKRILAPGSEVHNLLDGALTNPYGELITMSKVKAIMVINRSNEDYTGIEGTHVANTTNLLNIGGGADNFVFLESNDDFLELTSGSSFMHSITNSAGWTVNAARKNIGVASSGAEALYDIVVVGVT